MLCSALPAIERDENSNHPNKTTIGKTDVQQRLFLPPLSPAAWEITANAANAGGTLLCWIVKCKPTKN